MLVGFEITRLRYSYLKKMHATRSETKSLIVGRFILASGSIHQEEVLGFELR